MKDREEVLYEEKERLFTKKQIVWIIVSAVSLMVIVIGLLFGIDQLEAYKHKRTNHYLQEVEQLLKESEQALLTFKEGEDVPVELLPIIEATGKEWIATAQSLNAPSAFTKHKEAVKQLILKRYSVVSSAALMVEINNYQVNTIEELLAASQELVELEKEQLFASLEAAQIKYELLEDGTIRYYIRN